MLTEQEITPELQAHDIRQYNFTINGDSMYSIHSVCTATSPQQNITHPLSFQPTPFAADITLITCSCVMREAVRKT